MWTSTVSRHLTWLILPSIEVEEQWDTSLANLLVRIVVSIKDQIGLLQKSLGLHEYSWRKRPLDNFSKQGHAQVAKPGFVYFPSEVIGIAQEGSKGRWVHLVLLGLQVSLITWLVTRTLPFYARGLLRAVPAGVLPEAFAIAALTDPDIEVMMDHHLLPWTRAKAWDNYGPITGYKLMGLCYEDSGGSDGYCRALRFGAGRRIPRSGRWRCTTQVSKSRVWRWRGSVMSYWGSRTAYTQRKG